MIDEHEIGNGNGYQYRCTFGNDPAFHAGPERHNAYYGACIVYILNLTLEPHTWSFFDGTSHKPR